MECKDCDFYDSGICMDNEEYINPQGELCCRYQTGAIPYERNINMITEEQGDRIIQLLEAILEEVETERTKEMRWQQHLQNERNRERLKGIK